MTRSSEMLNSFFAEVSSLGKVGCAGAGTLGAWLLYRYVQRVREFNQIACQEPSLLMMGRSMLATGGDLGKTFIALFRKYGNAPKKLRFMGGGINLMIISSPGMDQLSPMPKGKWYAMIHVLFGSQNLITLNHDEHKRHRRLLSHGFSMGVLHGFIPAFDRHTKNLVKAWQDLHTVDLHQWMTRVTFDIIADLAFGYDSKCIEGSVHGNEFANSCCKVAKMVMLHWLHIPGMAKFWRLVQHRTFSLVDDTIYQCIADRRAERANRSLNEKKEPTFSQVKTPPRSRSNSLSPRAGSGNARDLLDLMLDNGEFTDLELRDEAFIFFLAGHETTAITMTWLFAHLAADMHLQQRLREEFRSVLGTQPLSKDTEKRLPLMDNIINETLRLYPPAFSFTRHAETDVVIDGVRIPAGYDVFIDLLSMHRDPGAFPNPEVYDADRWAKNPEAKGTDGRKYFAPFWMGPRQCIGMNLARLEMKTVVSEIIRAYEIRLVGPIPDWNTLPITTSPNTPQIVELKRLG